MKAKVKTVVKKKTSPLKKAAAKKAPLKKYPNGGEYPPKKKTPFQEYLDKNPGATASDTVSVRTGPYLKTIPITKPGFTDNSGLAVKKAANPKNQKALDAAFEKTYGNKQEAARSLDGSSDKTESLEQYRRRMGSTYKKGGIKKSAPKKPTTKKYKSGGVKKTSPKKK